MVNIEPNFAGMLTLYSFPVVAASSIPVLFSNNSLDMAQSFANFINKFYKLLLERLRSWRVFR